MGSWTGEDEGGGGNGVEEMTMREVPCDGEVTVGGEVGFLRMI